MPPGIGWSLDALTVTEVQKTVVESEKRNTGGILSFQKDSEPPLYNKRTVNLNHRQIPFFYLPRWPRSKMRWPALSLMRMRVLDAQAGGPVLLSVPVTALARGLNARSRCSGSVGSGGRVGRPHSSFGCRGSSGVSADACGSRGPSTGEGSFASL